MPCWPSTATSTQPITSAWPNDSPAPSPTATRPPSRAPRTIPTGNDRTPSANPSPTSCAPWPPRRTQIHSPPRSRRPRVRAETPWNAREALGAVFIPNAPLLAVLDFRRPAALCDHEGVPRGTAIRRTTRCAVRLSVSELVYIDRSCNEARGCLTDLGTLPLALLTPC
jgi:hypothetical protein